MPTSHAFRWLSRTKSSPGHKANVRAPSPPLDNRASRLPSNALNIAGNNVVPDPVDSDERAAGQTSEPFRPAEPTGTATFEQRLGRLDPVVLSQTLKTSPEATSSQQQEDFYIQRIRVLPPGGHIFERAVLRGARLDSGSSVSVTYLEVLEELGIVPYLYDPGALEGIGHSFVQPVGKVAIYWFDPLDPVDHLRNPKVNLTDFLVLADPPEGQERRWDFLLGASYLLPAFLRRLNPAQVTGSASNETMYLALRSQQG